MGANSSSALSTLGEIQKLLTPDTDTYCIFIADADTVTGVNMQV